MNQSKVTKIRNDQIFPEMKSDRFERMSESFNQTEKRFLINNINRRSDLNLDDRDLNLVSIQFLIEFLSEIDGEMQTDAGRLLLNLIKTKIKSEK